MKRRSLSKSASRKNFSGSANRVHKYNISGAPMRGGIRL